MKMTPELWRRVEALYDAALMHRADRRDAFLADACAGDEELRNEVASLLAQRSAAGLLEAPAPVNPASSPLTGRRLGVYEVHERIGVGGMGEVYRARDTKLRRDVAIKILPLSFINDPDRMVRFEREARLLASLNHPNIGAIYGLEEADGIQALVLELVAGLTLAQRIARGPVPVKDALKIAVQILEALDNAHQKGIVHRDLKPSNIKITPEGVVKILDFGLARVVSNEAHELGTEAPTATGSLTPDGFILGTAAYMGPEQASGKRIDKRADIWAFGCVLYEMLTGMPAFQGEHLADFLVAVMTKEPNWAALPPATPPRIVELLRRCLRKDPRQRLRDIGDALMELEDALESPAGRSLVPPDPAESIPPAESRTKQAAMNRAGRTPGKRYKFDAFLSYAPPDGAWATRLTLALQERGLKIWLDREQSRAGISTVDLEAGLQLCKSCVLVVSADAIRSQWVSEEYHRTVALAKQKDRPLRVIPIILGKAELPGFLSTRNWVEFLDDTTFDSNLDRLIWGITGAKRQPKMPSFVVTQAAETAKPADPYIFERPAIGEHFFGRKLEMTRLVNALKEGRSVVVYGLQRVGKTSLVKEALDRELKSSNVPLRDIRIDMYESCETLTSYIDFFETMIDRFCDDLNVADYKKVRDQARQVLRTGNDPGAIRGLMRNLLRGFAGRYGRALLYIDEFQDIRLAFEKAERQKTTRHPLDSGFIRYLGSLVKEGYLQLLCCGRYQIQLLDNKLDTQLLKLMVPIELSVLDESSARRLIEEPVIGRYSYASAAVDHILTLSGRYPYVVQYLCYELVERARNDNRSMITLEDVNAVVEVVQEPQVRLLYADFQELEDGIPWRLLLSIANLAEEERQIVMWEEVFRMCEESFGEGLTHNSCAQALKLLTSSQILGEEQTRDSVGYFVRPDLLRIWLRKKNLFYTEKIASRIRRNPKADDRAL